MSIAIIGTGFAGIGMAIRLLQQGRRDFTIFERAQEIGGVWREQTYPGCACDVEALLYSLSFAPSAEWSQLYAPRGEIFAYLRGLVDRMGLRTYIRFGHEVKGASWDHDDNLWRIETSKGEFRAQVLISASGSLSAPNIPTLKGLSDFKGKIMHSARWDHSFDLSGRRVALLGTGASAAQIIPEIQPKVAKLTLFQRTPAWVLPRGIRKLGPGTRSFLRANPWAQRLWRRAIYLQREVIGFGFRHPRLQFIPKLLALYNLRRAVASPELRAKLRPSYTIGCKRILLSNDYYPALSKANAEVVPEAVIEVRAHSVVAADGREYPADVLLLCTGFHVTDAPYAECFRGSEGLSLADVWLGKPRAFLGTTVHGFPNLFLLHGPNTGLGHTSVLLLTEAQIEHTLGALRFLQATGLSAIEPRLSTQQAFNAGVERKSQGTVWVSGDCSSYYLDSTGYNASIWPASVALFRRLTEHFRPQDYQKA